jgi:tripeptidyl-peptidase-1
LDIEYIMGIGVGVPTYYISTGGLHENQEPFLEWATALNSMTPVPWVHSVSYGDYEHTIDVTFADAVDVQFIKLATRGVSVMFASGDSGAGCNRACNTFVPNWPASDPWITAVGGVYLAGNQMHGDTISSGGFSTFFEMPAYQSQTVKSYLAGAGNKIPPAKYFNSTGRAMPDVAAFSENVIIKIHGGDMPIGGTSCACPIFSGMVSLLNDQLLQKGSKPLGFLNPLLYKLASSTPSVFTDITEGSNPYGCCPGFKCASGWDAVTGLGVPNYNNLRSAILSMLNLADD